MLALVFAMGGFALAATDSATTKKSQRVKACYSKKSGDLRVLVKGKKRCRTGERKLTWNRRGLRGFKGATGVAGAKGDPGDPGAVGPAGPQGPAGLSSAEGGDATLGPGSVGNTAIADGSITASKIAPGAITEQTLGLKVIVAESAADSTSPKFVGAGCPVGKQLISGGAGTYEGLGIPFTGPVAMSFSNSTIGNAWIARAYETSATASNWRLTVYAYCINDG